MTTETSPSTGAAARNATDFTAEAQRRAPPIPRTGHSIGPSVRGTRAAGRSIPVSSTSWVARRSSFCRAATSAYSAERFGVRGDHVHQSWNH